MIQELGQEPGPRRAAALRSGRPNPGPGQEPAQGPPPPGRPGAPASAPERQAQGAPQEVLQALTEAGRVRVRAAGREPGQGELDSAGIARAEERDQGVPDQGLGASVARGPRGVAVDQLARATRGRARAEEGLKRGAARGAGPALALAPDHEAPGQAPGLGVVVAEQEPDGAPGVVVMQGRTQEEPGRGVVSGGELEAPGAGHHEGGVVSERRVVVAEEGREGRALAGGEAEEGLAGRAPGGWDLVPQPAGPGLPGRAGGTLERVEGACRLGRAPLGLEVAAQADAGEGGRLGRQDREGGARSARIEAGRREGRGPRIARQERAEGVAERSARVIEELDQAADLGAPQALGGQERDELRREAWLVLGGAQERLEEFAAGAELVANRERPGCAPDLRRRVLEVRGEGVARQGHLSRRRSQLEVEGPGWSLEGRQGRGLQGSRLSCDDTLAELGALADEGDELGRDEAGLALEREEALGPELEGLAPSALIGVGHDACVVERAQGQGPQERALGGGVSLGEALDQARDPPAEVEGEGQEGREELRWSLGCEDQELLLEARARGPGGLVEGEGREEVASALVGGQPDEELGGHLAVGGPDSDLFALSLTVEVAGVGPSGLGVARA